MNTHLKRRIASALLMGAISTGVVSFILLALNHGISSVLFAKWLRAWSTGYIVVVPVILLIGPRVHAQVERLVR
ncbi:DUF2798 domain-containing protein [Lysobacter soli]|uniref:DUF2798 domain-containing protein n=1 Tax=Lysobacter soli TaxID=453783 RepID=UPI0037C7D99F